MASLASLVSLGSSTASSSDGTLSLVRRVSLVRGRGRRWNRVSFCKLSVTTDFIAEQGNANPNAISLGSTYNGSNGSESDLVLKPSPRPLPKPVKPTIPTPPLGANSDDGRSEDEQERKKVIHSLGEVLAKAEILETSRTGAFSSNDSVASSTSSSQRAGRPANVAVNNKKAATSKSVWIKGSPVANVHKFVKDIPKIGDSSVDQESKTVGKGRAEYEPRGAPDTAESKGVWRKGNPVSNVQKFVKDLPSTGDSTTEQEENKTDSGSAVAPSSRQPPSRPQPVLQARPSVAPPAPLPVKRPVILRDAGGAPKSAPATDSTSPKARGPILVDKFAFKRPVVDPLIAKAVLGPPKPGKSAPPSKFKDDYRKKNASTGVSRRRKVEDDVDPDDESAELNVSIARAGATRKKRKWTKASRKAARLQKARDAAPVKVDIIEVDEEGMLIEDLAFSLATSEGEILGFFYSKGIKPDGVQTMDKDMVKMICKEYDVEVVDADPVKVEEQAKKKEIFDEEDMDKLMGRPPVLTIMGHVDHGKTTLLDFIRTSKVTASEAGGITQGIGAYKVMVPFDGKLQPCVFLDTPGHEAFSSMRARGARVTDIAIIVVAADDGIRPQTNEAIAHAKAAGVPIVIAINKIDKEGANPERVMQELSSIGLMPEDWGGDVPMIPISALKGEKVDDLLETVMLVAELQEFKANPDRNAKGTVIEAGLHKSKGPVATFIVQNGTLKRGDVVVCGEAFGKVRGLFDDSGKPAIEAGPSIPIQVLGLNNVPQAGDEFEVVASLDIARERAEARAMSLRDERIAMKAGDGKVTLSDLAYAVSSRKQTGLDLHQLNIILKVDVQGSIEAVKQALQVLPQENVSLKFLLQATGDISASDVDLAVATKGIILGFNVRVPGSVKSQAESKGVEIRLYRVIYDLIDDVRKAMEGLLDLVEEQIPIGTAEIRAVFSSGSGRVAGCMVTDGKLVKGCGIRVIRKRKTVHVGKVDSLRRVKETVEEVGAGLECGVGMDDFDAFEEGDTLEAFNSVQKKRTLEEASATIAAALEGAGYNKS